MSTKTIERVPAFFTAESWDARMSECPEARELQRFSLRWSRHGMCPVSVFNWNGDKVHGLGAGGCGYDKAGTCLGQVIMRIAGPDGMNWLARNVGHNSGSGDPHGLAGLYGFRWWFVELRTLSDKGRKLRAPRYEWTERASKLREEYAKRSHLAPDDEALKLAGDAYGTTFELRAGLDGACGRSCMEGAALRLGFVFDRVDCGKSVDGYIVRRVDVEKHSWRSTATGAPYCEHRAAGAP